jgi:FkbM family methyltransferase
VTSRKVSYAQNAEDVRVWRAFASRGEGLTYVDVGANEPRHLSITASLSDLGWRGLLIEADPELAAELRIHRPGDTVVECAAAAGAGELTFFRVPGTGLGTLDAEEAQAARARGFAVDEVVVPTAELDTILDAHHLGDVHFMSIDVEGAESIVLQGLSLERHRPWVLCVEAVLPGTTTPSHDEWEPRILTRGYRYVTFDGVNRWYVADEHADLADQVAVPFNAIDAGADGWVLADHAHDRDRADRAAVRRAWQRETILHDVRSEVPTAEYLRQIAELREALVAVQGSRSWSYSRRVAKVGKVAVFKGRRLLEHLPSPIERALVRRRHLRHVTVNMGHLTDPAYLGSAPADTVGWISPDGLPDAPTMGLDLHAFTPDDAVAVRAWIDAGPYDTDALLDRRTDNHGDELGRALDALRLRLRLAGRPAAPLWAGGNRALFDARSLQSPAFGTRGIGRFARAALVGLRSALGDDAVVLLVDPGLEPLPAELAGSCEQVRRVTERTLPTFSVLVQPSPMTASAEPLLPLLHSSATKIAVVFDFIPLHYPTVYLRHVAARAEYAAALDALRLYDEFVCISNLAEQQLGEYLKRPLTGDGALRTAVAWPDDVLPAGGPAPSSASSASVGPIVVMTGDEPRKNTFGALAAIGAATSNESGRDVVVVGMAGHDAFVHHLSISAAMRPGEVRTAGRIDDAALSDLLGAASAVVVTSFDEGLSLPVIEAIGSGVPVVASDIPAHRELLGRGSFLADPRDPRSIARAVRRHRGRTSTAARQRSRLAGHAHVTLEDAVATSLARNARSAVVELPSPPVFAGGRPLRVGIATPWPPQRSGVADYSAATISELATSVRRHRLHDERRRRRGHDAARGAAPLRGNRRRRSARAHEHDVFVSVVGNSHFHLPMVELLDHVESVVIAHDTRMVELYLALRDRGGLEKLMLRGSGRWELDPPLDEQIDDMRLLQNAGFWEIARRARMLVTHSLDQRVPQRITRGDGRHPATAPAVRELARTPDSGYRVGEDMRDAGAGAPWLRRPRPLPDTVHLATFGFVDVRTKHDRRRWSRRPRG